MFPANTLACFWPGRGSGGTEQVRRVLGRGLGRIFARIFFPAQIASFFHVTLLLLPLEVPWAPQAHQLHQERPWEPWGILLALNVAYAPGKGAGTDTFHMDVQGKLTKNLIPLT